MPLAISSRPPSGFPQEAPGEASDDAKDDSADSCETVGEQAAAPPPTSGDRQLRLRESTSCERAPPPPTAPTAPTDSFTANGEGAITDASAVAEPDALTYSTAVAAPDARMGVAQFCAKGG